MSLLGYASGVEEAAGTYGGSGNGILEITLYKLLRVFERLIAFEEEKKASAF
ncbi:MAG: hypothetical protein R2778_16545 [Saprospiraceae bacterium]